MSEDAQGIESSHLVDAPPHPADIPLASTPNSVPEWLDPKIPTPVSKVLIWLNVAVFVAMLNAVFYFNAHILPGSPIHKEPFLWFSAHTLNAWGANSAIATLLDGQYWRIITNTFVHANLLHLAMNVWVLASFTPMTERLFGSQRFLCLYLLSAFASSAIGLAYLEPSGVAIGASGAIFGTFGAFVAYLIFHRKHFPGHSFRAYARMFFLIAVFSVVNSLLFHGMDNAAHLSGFLVGLFAGFACMPASPGERVWTKTKLRFAAVALAASGAAFLLDSTYGRTPALIGERAYQKALISLQHYNPAGALPWLDQAVECMPRNVSVRLDRAAAYGMLRQHARAVTDLDVALSLDPKNKKGYFERAARLHSLGEDEKAIDDLNQVIKLDPKAVLAFSNRAWYNAVLEHRQDAIADSARAIALNPDAPWPYDVRGVAECISGSYAQALVDFDRYISLKRKGIRNGAVYYHRAFALYKLGDTQQARQNLLLARASVYQLEPSEKRWFATMLQDI